jgi:serine protease Do
MYEENLNPNEQPNPEKTEITSQTYKTNTVSIDLTQYQPSQPYQVYQTTGGFETIRKPSEKKVKKRKVHSGFFKRALTAVSLGILFGLFGGAAAYAVWQVGDAITDKDELRIEIDQTDVGGKISTEAQTTVSTAALAEAQPIKVVTTDFSQVVEEQMPAMVAINSTVLTTESYFGQIRSYEQESGGSGIIVEQSEDELLVVTNYHVVEDTITLEVVFIDGTTAEAVIKGTEPDMDLAVMAIPLDSLSSETKRAIKIATLGDSDSLKLGEPVCAIGNALGYGQSVTTGSISAIERQITLENGSVGTFIQTDAAINPGNSGGALLNIKGEVIGINSNKLGGTLVEGVGFAIPISDAIPYIEELFTRETRMKVAEPGYMGISYPQTITEEMSAVYDMPVGLLMIIIQKDSPADKGGLLQGDIIIEMEGQTVVNFEDLQKILEYYGPGETVTLNVMREINDKYVEVEISITLGNKSDFAE